MNLRRPACSIVLCIALLTTVTFSSYADSDLTKISLQDLMEVNVYSVAKKSQKLFSAASAIYVINADDIRRSGATSIAELLRMVPGVSVQQVNAHAWDISARGFHNSVFANKMLVLMDGRAVYTPLYGGVFWDVQDTVLEDIERIEVIRGPGGTLWGANAVNGVINVITKKAKDTQGQLLVAGGGSEERYFGTYRYGGHDKDWYYRVYSKYFDRDEGFRASGTANDEWAIARGGFKAEKDKLTVQGDFYEGHVGQRTVMYNYSTPYSYIIDKPVYVLGGNITSKYQDEDWSIQGYWDMTDRDLQLISENRNTFDIEYIRKYDVNAANQINWGLAYRLQMEDIGNSEVASINTTTKADQLFSLFLQDEMRSFDDRLKFTIGSKVEHNIYTGVEVQPNARLGYEINDNNMVWASVSRAVRTPSRIEEDADLVSSFTAPSSFLEITGNRDLSSERMNAFEIGYRTQPLSNLYIDLAAFYNQYDRLIAFIPGDSRVQSGVTVTRYPTVNGLSGEVSGVEMAADIKVQEWWKIKNSYTFSKGIFHTNDDIPSIGLEASLESGGPRHTFYSRSSFDLPHNFEFDATLRYSDSFSDGRVPTTTEMDINLTKKIRDWEISLIGQNLFRNQHRESILSNNTQIQRGGYAKVTRRF